MGTSLFYQQNQELLISKTAGRCTQQHDPSKRRNLLSRQAGTSLGTHSSLNRQQRTKRDQETQDLSISIPAIQSSHVNVSGNDAFKWWDMTGHALSLRVVWSRFELGSFKKTFENKKPLALQTHCPDCGFKGVLLSYLSHCVPGKPNSASTLENAKRRFWRRAVFVHVTALKTVVWISLFDFLQKNSYQLSILPIQFFKQNHKCRRCLGNAH